MAFQVGNFNNLFLVGPMGAGKSMVGKDLARKLNKKFFDLDTQIEKITRLSIPEIFEFEGEGSFRRTESLVLAELVEQENTVIATGGGCILNPINGQLLQAKGTVIYLKAAPETQYQRTYHETHRPLLQGNDEERLDQLIRHTRIRAELYQSYSDFEVDTDDQTIVDVVNTIKQWLSKHEAY